MVSAVMAAVAAATPVQADEGKNKVDGNQHGWRHDGCKAALWRLLPEEKQKLLHETMEKVHKENASLRDQKHKLHQELDALMKAPEFDKDAFLAKTAQMDALHDKMKSNAEKQFASVAGEFTPEERKILVEMRHMHHHGFHHEHDKKSEDKANG